ncbi:hypothetical protein JCGZ_01547 [Jatropha curcas]|uniref:ADP-ribosyl cyclase/cyclic ADP-ribose hydrolase n=1 Tax=Jatropha curcas TaxID=180498 RepID=A0A067L9F0_JATCU|nr:hypothetical protein JCGZ_01547 [Jatropha curcas]
MRLCHYRDESEFIQDIVEDILSQLRRSSHSIAKDFVGMESRLEKINDYLDLGNLSKVKTIGICGMGGIGKTTISSVVYKDIYCQFEGSCFLENVRESSEKYGIVSLQKQLLSATLMDKDIQIYDAYRGTDEISNRLSRKKILAILDDVDQVEQLEFLIGKKDEHWFGIGSRIIITTRDEHLLKKHGADEIYRVEELSQDDAFKLFCSKAFKNNHHKEEYVELCNDFVKYASGLPLALNIIGMEKEYVIKVLESCGFFPESGIGELIDKSLITIRCGHLWMHDLVQEMGREIVRKESREDPSLRSRIWLDKDLYHVQVKDMKTEQVKAIVLHSWKQEEEHLSAKVFSRVKELRLLILRSVPTSQEVEYLSNELSYLEWYKCPCRTFPSNFQPDKLVQLHMQHSSIERLWKRSMKPIKLLKVIDLSYSESLIETPDFRGIPNLEELNLEGCKNLHEVHQSIGVLKRLVFLNLKNCGNLVSLPSSMCNLKSLKSLILRGCSKLMKLPNMLGDMNCLEVLDAAGIGMQQLELAKQWNFHLLSWLMPSTWKNPEPMVMAFPSALPFLKELNLSYCNLPEGAIPNDLSGFPLLEGLNLSGNNFMTLPSSINHLSQLHCLELSNCKKLQSLPDLPSNIICLYVKNCTSLESLPNLSDKPNVKDFQIDFSYCSKLNDKKGTINVAFTWLKSFLLSFLKIRPLLRIQEICTNMDQLHRICHKKGIYPYRSLSFLDFSMYLPGSEIPDWFNYQSSNSPLKIYLSSTEKWWNIAGFVVCIVLAVDEETTCKFAVYSKNKAVWETAYLLNGRSDHLYLFFIANPLIDPYEEKSPTKVKLTFDEIEIKKCGIRIVHEKEIEELVQLGKPLENLYAFQNFEEIYSPSHEESFDSGEEVSTELEFWSEGEADDMELGICCSDKEEDHVEWEISCSGRDEDDMEWEIGSPLREFD